MRGMWLNVAVLLLLVGIGIREAAPAEIGGLILFTGAVSRLWSRASLTRLDYRRRLSNRRAFVGESIDVVFTLANRKPIPVPWIEIKELVPEQVPPDGAHVSPSPRPQTLLLNRSTSLAWYERVSWQHRFHCTARGYYQFGPVSFRSGDVFGLFPSTLNEERVDHLTVLPRLLDLREIGLPALRPFGESSNRSAVFEDQSRIVGMRDYRPGDPLKRIDWKATARRQQLQSRLYEPASTLSMLIAVNVSTLEHPWEGYDPLLLERAISVAGSVARYGDEKRYAMGLAANCTFPNADRNIWLPPGRDPEQLTRILEALAMVSPYVLAPLDDVLQNAGRRLPQGVTMVVVAGYMTQDLHAYLSRPHAESGRWSLVWVGDRPPPSLPDKVQVYDAGPHLREFELRWQSERGAAARLGAWIDR